MPYKVLVVEDSSFFRRRVTDILNSDKDLEVIDVAVNGVEAVAKAKALKPDVITMDIEMPLLNGIEAVKQIMASEPTSIIMFSSLTHHGAKSTLDALSAGALDFLPKKFSEIAKNTDDAGLVLRQRVVQLAKKNRNNASNIRSTPIISKSKDSLIRNVENRPLVSKINSPIKNLSGKEYKLLAIGTSTGGPIALQKILTQLPENFPVPIILVQHMPASFTKAFADRLNGLCKISVKEAEHGDLLKPGCAYLAPGGKQMLVEGTQSSPKLKVIEDSSPRIAFKPSVDITFGSTAKVFGGNVLGIILTGMGSDGRDGCRLLKSKGATIWSESEESCVVYGMPQAVANAGISVAAIALPDIVPSIFKEMLIK